MPNLLTRAVVLVCPSFVIAAPCVAQSLSSQQIAIIDAAATKALADTGVPAASIAVVREGKLVYVKAYGMQRKGQPARTDARYSIASTGKQMTAAAVLILADEGRLSLDDKVAKYLPDLTRAGDITIRQLLSHTAGYRDYFPQDFTFEDATRPITPAAILDRWAKTPLDFEPGTRWQYSNTGYVAAGRIVEIVSSRPFADFMRERVFARLGMKPVDIDTGLAATVPQGYSREALGPPRPAKPVAKGWSFAAGQFAMTASDLARWDISIIERSIMSPAAYSAQQHEIVLSNGLGTDYGLGVQVKSVRGHRMIAHPGGDVGFLTDNRVFPDDRSAIVVAVNADYGDAQEVIADAIEEQLFADSSGVDRARTLYDMLRSGKFDRSIFTANGNYFFNKETVEMYRSTLADLGAPKSIEQTQTGLRGGFTVERFLFDYGNRKVEVTLRAEPGVQGKVEQFTISPAS